MKQVVCRARLLLCVVVEGRRQWKRALGDKYEWPVYVTFLSIYLSIGDTLGK